MLIFFFPVCREPKPSTSIVSTTNNTSNFVSKRSRIDEMGSREQQMEQKDDEIEKEIDPNAPTIKICLRLPNGSKETITVVETDTVEVSTINHQFFT